MPGGRPSKYKPEYCDQLIKHMEGGLSYESFAGTIRVNRDTLYQWEKVNPDFSDAKKTGHELRQLFWERVGRNIALGIPTTLDGKSYDRANVTAWIFTMKNACNWSDKRDIKHTGETSSRLVIDLSAADDDDKDSDDE